MKIEEADRNSQDYFLFFSIWLTSTTRQNATCPLCRSEVHQSLFFFLCHARQRFSFSFVCDEPLTHYYYQSFTNIHSILILLRRLLSSQGIISSSIQLSAGEKERKREDVRTVEKIKKKYSVEKKNSRSGSFEFSCMFVCLSVLIFED